MEYLPEIILAIIISLIIVFIIYYFYSKGSTETYSNLSNQIYSNGWRLITKKNCIFCEKQQNILKYPSIDISQIKDKSIKGVPYWININDGRDYTGVLDLEKLMLLTS